MKGRIYQGPPLCAEDCLNCVYPDCYKHMAMPHAGKPKQRPEISNVQRNREACRKYYSENKQKFRERYKRNRERIAAYQKAYRESNKEKMTEYQKRYREENAERIRATKRAYREKKKEQKTNEAR